jgi:hypothetical protein
MARTQIDPAPSFAAAVDAATASQMECRALVALSGDGEVGPLTILTGLRATFVAQLISARNSLPQSRALGRASPADAVEAYAAGPKPRERQSGIARTV